ncbi:MAG: helix-turn-helix domain-containing protein [Pseudomonadota bacterium]
MADETAFLLPDHKAAALLGISRAKLWRGAKSSELPAPVKLGGRTLWRRDELLAVVERATAERDAEEAA